MVSHRKIDDRSLPVRDLSCAKELPADHRAFVEPGIKVVAVQEQLEMAWSILVPSFLEIANEPYPQAVTSVTRFGKISPLWPNFSSLWQYSEG